MQTEINEDIKRIIPPLLDEKIILLSKIKKIEKAIESLQDICEHDWKNNGHDSHKDHYICEICNLEDSW